MKSLLLWNKGWNSITLDTERRRRFASGTDGGELDDDLDDDCMVFESDILKKETLSRIHLFLFPLAIEFVLTGAIFSYHMYKQVGLRWANSMPKIICSIKVALSITSSSSKDRLSFKSPDPVTFFKNRDYNHTIKGSFFGIIVLLASLASAVWFLTHTTDLVKIVPINRIK